MQTSTILSVREVSVTFPDGNGGLRVLERVSFEVMSGEFLAVIGPSGCGKTTLLRIIANSLTPTSGDVRFRNNRRPRMGIVFQDACLMPWRTVLENVKLPLELFHVTDADAHARRLIELVNLKGFEDKWPRELSGGMAQRVGIARALSHDPDLLLLDEPFAALDALTRERMGVELLHIWQKYRKTVVMVTHSISEALFLADRILVLTAQPANIKLSMEVDLPRPRKEEMIFDSKFVEMARKLKFELDSSGKDAER